MLFKGQLYNEIRSFIVHNLVTLHLDWIGFFIIINRLLEVLKTCGTCRMGEKVLRGTNTIRTFCIRAVFAL